MGKANRIRSERTTQGVVELQAALITAAQAINRLESFTFAIFKTMLDKGHITIADFSVLSLLLQQCNTLQDFWGMDVEAIKAEAIAASLAGDNAEKEEVLASTAETATVSAE